MLRWKDSNKFLPTVDQLWGIFQWLYQNPFLSRIHTFVSEIARSPSLAIQWLWFHVFNVGAWVPFLVWKLRSHIPCGTTTTTTTTKNRNGSKKRQLSRWASNGEDCSHTESFNFKTDDQKKGLLNLQPLRKKEKGDAPFQWPDMHWREQWAGLGSPRSSNQNLQFLMRFHILIHRESSVFAVSS